VATDLVQMKGIAKSYGPVTALDGVDFAVRENEIVGLLGDNGAGKSTLIKILSGTVTATRGEIFVRGKKVADPQHHRRHRPGHRDDPPGLGAGDAAVDRPQPVPRP
jgi:ABC-type sugar transport system ATPase subunit